MDGASLRFERCIVLEAIFRFFVKIYKKNMKKFSRFQFETEFHLILISNFNFNFQFNFISASWHSAANGVEEKVGGGGYGLRW